MKLLYSINNKLKDTIRFRVILFLSAVLLIILREPALFIHPRLWAEEGTIFYAFALHHSLWDVFTTVHVGYLTLFNSIVSIMQVKLFSVENAAIVSTYMGLVVQLIPVYIIIFATNKFWNTSLKKIICTLIVIVVMAPELWLNTTNSHFIFGLITFLILIISGSNLSNVQKYLFRALLLIGGLTGPASILFTPVFLLKAYREKEKEKYIQLILMSVCAIIQASVILYAVKYNNTYHRLTIINYKTTIYHFIVDNFSLLPHTPLLNFQIFSFELITLFGMTISVLMAYLFIINRKNGEYLIYIASFIIIATSSTLGSLDMSGGARYSYIPTCILLMIIVTETLDKYQSNDKPNYVISIILMTGLIVNIIWYKPLINEWAYKPTYPKWSCEVAKWRVDSSYIPKIHPAFNDNGWPVKL
jgi:hypothetical protein